MRNSGNWYTQKWYMMYRAKLALCACANGMTGSGDVILIDF